MNRVLIIEDDPDIALSLRYSLENEGAVSEEGESNPLDSYATNLNREEF